MFGVGSPSAEQSRVRSEDMATVISVSFMLLETVRFGGIGDVTFNRKSTLDGKEALTGSDLHW